MRSVFKRGGAARAIVVAVSLCAIISAGEANAQLAARDIRGVAPNAPIERPERPHPKQPPSFLKRLIAIVLGDQLDIPRP